MSRFIPFIGTAIMLTALGGGTALAQGGLPYQIAPPPDSVSFGTAIASGGDIDGDKCDDILIMDWDWQDANGNVVGKFYCYSGVDGSLLWSDIGPGPGSAVHNAAFIPGVGPNGTAGVAVSFGNEERSSQSTAGEIRMYTGADGELLWTTPGEPSAFEVGTEIISIDDMTGDEVDEVVLCTIPTEPNGKIWILSGATGELVREFENIHYPIRIANGGDLTGDKISEVLITSWLGFVDEDEPAPGVVARNKVMIIDGVSGVTVRVLGSPLFPYEDFGLQLAGNVDMDGDHIPDYLVGGTLGPTYLFSGRDGTILREYKHSFLVYGNNWAGFADMTGDQLPEILIGTGWNSTLIYDARSSTAIGYWWSRRYWDSLYPWALEHAVGDLNGDGKDDFLGNVRFRENVRPQAYPGAWLMLSIDPRGFRPRLRDPLIFKDPDGPNDFMVSGTSPNGRVHLLASRKGNECTFIHRLGMCIDLSTPLQYVGAFDADENGMAYFEVNAPATMPNGYIWFQAIELNHRKFGPIRSNALLLDVVDH